MENPGRKEGRNAKEERNKGRKEGETKEARKEGRKIRRKKRRTPTPSTLIQVIRIIPLLLIIIVRPNKIQYLYQETANANSPPQSRFKYLRTSKDRTRVDPLSTRDRGVCKWGFSKTQNP